jgi:hypothetical protein
MTSSTHSRTFRRLWYKEDREEQHLCRSLAPGAEEGMESVDLLCSRNARPQKALVGRAQLEINQPPSLKRYRASLEGSSVALLDGRSETGNRCRSWEMNRGRRGDPES